MPDSNKYITVDDYINDQPKEVQIKLRELREYIFEAVPNASELFNYGIPAFALVKGGKRDTQIMIAGYKKHVGLYPDPTAIEHFKNELESYKQGKGSIQFPVNEELPKELIIRMIRYRKSLIDDLTIKS